MIQNGWTSISGKFPLFNVSCCFNPFAFMKWRPIFGGPFLFFTCWMFPPAVWSRHVQTSPHPITVRRIVRSPTVLRVQHGSTVQPTIFCFAIPRYSTRPTKRREAHPKKQVSPSSTSGSPNHPWQGIKQRNKWGKTVKFGSKINLFECRMKKLVVIWHYAHGSCLETWMVKSTKSIVKLPVVNWYHASPFWPNSWMLDALPMTWRSNLPSLGTTTSQHISTVQAKPHGHCPEGQANSENQWNIAAEVVQRRLKLLGTSVRWDSPYHGILRPAVH